MNATIPVGDAILDRLDRIEATLSLILTGQKLKELYSTAEAAERLGRAEWTVRDWCRTGRALAVKQKGGRGKHKAWAIPHAELERLRNEGPLPLGEAA